MNQECTFYEVDAFDDLCKLYLQKFVTNSIKVQKKNETIKSSYENLMKNISRSLALPKCNQLLKGMIS